MVMLLSDLNLTPNLCKIQQDILMSVVNTWIYRVRIKLKGIYVNIYVYIL